jgi:hypothetical protein
MMPLPSRARFLSLAALSWLLAGRAQADSFPSWFAKAQKAEARHDEDAALQAWSNALHLWKSTDSKPKKAQALAARAALYEKKGDWEPALKDLSGALKIDTKDAGLFHRRGDLYLEHGKTAEAISDFYKATALKLDYSEAFFDRGRAYEAQGDAEFSKEDFRTACHLGLQKACAKAGVSKGSAKSKSKSKSKVPAGGSPHGAAAPPPAASVQTSSAPAGAAAAPPASRASSDTAPSEISVGSTVEELPTGEAAIPEESPQEAPEPDFNSCINRIRSCSENGNSYSICVSRTRLCETEPKKGCCPHDCVVLFKKTLNTKSEAEAFREVFTPKSSCLSIRKPKSDEGAEDLSR